MKVHSVNFKNKKVLITGISGFKGTWLACWLHILGAKVYGFSLHDVPEPSMFRIIDAFKIAQFQPADIRNFDTVKKIIHEVKPDFIFHIAAQALTRKAFTNPLETYQINVMGTTHILEALREYNKPCAAILITSDKCYENKEWLWGYRENDEIGGKDPYSASKGVCEIIISSYYRTYFSNENSPIKLSSVRAGNIIGGGDWAQDRIIPDAVRAWTKGLPITIRNGQSTRPWQHVLEPLNGYLSIAGALSEGKYNGEAFNFGPNEASCVTVEQLINFFSEQWTATLPDPSIVYKDSNEFLESKLLKLNCDKAAEALQWRPKLNITQTLKLTAEWYISHQEGKKMLDFSFNQIEEYSNL